MSLRDYVTMSQQQEEELAGRTAAAAATSANGDESSSSVSSSGLVEGRYGAPYDDPTVVSDTEILRARQQSDYTDDLTRLMFNDTAIALSPYNFTAPLRQDLLRALSVNGRRSINSLIKRSLGRPLYLMRTVMPSQSCAAPLLCYPQATYTPDFLLPRRYLSPQRMDFHFPSMHAFASTALRERQLKSKTVCSSPQRVLSLRK